MTYQEHHVTLSGDIAGILNQPTGDGPFPTVLMLHGFGSQKNEVGNLFQRLASQLGEQGIASLRIDFRGWGESGGGMENSTIDGMVEDANTAYEYLAEQEFVDTEQMGLLGFSLGGRVAIITASRNHGRYQSMALWSVGGNIPTNFLGQNTYDTAKREGQITVDLGFREVTLGLDFFDSMESYDVEAEFLNYEGSIFIIAGSEDEGPNQYLDWYLTNAQGARRSAYRIDGADHIFNVLSDDQTQANTVLQSTSDWFTMTLK